MKEEQLGSMLRELLETPPSRILQVILEAVFQAQLDQASSQGGCNSLVEDRRKRIREDWLKTGRNKEGQMEG